MAAQNLHLALRRIDSEDNRRASVRFHIEWIERDGFPKVTAILAGDAEVLVPLLLNGWIVLDR